MAVRAFLSDRFMEQGIPRLRARGLETRLGIDGRMVTFARNGAPVGTVEVVVDWAQRVPDVASGGTTNVVSTEGELSGRVGELTARAGDRFVLDGNEAEITVGAIADRGVAVAAFRITTGGR